MKAIQKFTKLLLAASCFISVITMNQVIEIKAADEDVGRFQHLATISQS